ncbi:MAG: peptide chain release factor N(5)-glutamine methyltransferase [Dehalococcoidia bacterium]|nr:peptide chain release factor N(5)-glutamine methyltransferase [Dehalococcoidia bacterium]
MTVLEALKEGQTRLYRSGIAEASLESELILRHILAANAAELYTRHKTELSPEHENAFFALLGRRLAGEPTAYLTSQREFYGLMFYVNSSVLIPRPETELLVAKALAAAEGYAEPIVADIGTGSGAVAISLAKHLPKAKLYAIDISGAALKTARHNAELLDVADKITFFAGDLVTPLPQAVDIMVANLPYVRSNELPDTGEPRLALDGGSDGLGVISRLIRKAPSKLNSKAMVLLEIGWGQERAVCHLLRLALPGSSTQVFSDLAGITRVLQVTLAS